MKKKLFFLVVLLVTMVAGAWGAGFTRTLTGNLEVTGYELKAFYDFQTNTPAVLPTEGDLRYRDGNVWGLHNFASGPRTAEVQIPVSEGNLLILQEYVDETNGITGFNATINCGTANDELSTSTGYHVFDITSNATTINITVPRYGGVVAALVMKVTGSEEAELPNLDDYDLVKSVTWDGTVDIAASGACNYTAYETGNKIQQALTILTSPEDAAGWIAMQAWTNIATGKGWWNRPSYGLYSRNAARSAAVFGDDLTTGWLVVFECTQDPAAVMTLTNKDGVPDGTFTYMKDTKNYYCTINAASNAYVGFCGVSNVGYISKISVYKPKSAVVEDAEITKVELQGNFATTGTDWNAVTLTGQSDNVYTGILDLTGYTDDKSFKLVVNGGGSDSDGYAGWIGTNNVSVDAPKDWVVSTSETDNGNLTLNNSQTGYQTYTVTATWEPNVDYYKGWSLKIEGKDARKYAVSVADGITNGTVTVDKTEAAEGEEVTVTATPAKGYELDAITVTGKTSNQAVTVTDGKFSMIADAVTVSATFKAHVHEFVLDPAQSSEPSCTEPGKTVSVCICGEKEEVEIPALGHNIGENGICTRCGYDSNQGGTTEGHHYEKVTSANDFTDGEYLIVYETGNVALNGALDGNIDAASNYVAAEIKKGNIASSDEVDAAVFTFATTTDQETSATHTTIKNASGFYIGHTGNKNTLNVSEETAFGNTVSFDDDGNALIVCDGYNLRYNSASGQTRFRYFSSTTQQHIALYKKVAGALPTSAVATPEISGMTPFVGSTTVTITCETQDASIYYTTDGTDPTNESTEYIEPFELSATATVKAIAYDVTGANSEIASKEFVATPGVATIAALNALENGTTFAYTGEALVVAKPTAKYVYIEDETGSSLIYDNSGQLTEAAEVGKTLAANWTGKVSIYNKLFEAIPDAALSVKDGDAVEVTYPEAQLSDVKADNVNQVVELKGVTYTLDGKALTISQGQAEAAGYNQFGLEIAAPVEGKTYSIVGAIGRYNDKIQFWPISIEEEKPAPLYVIGNISTGGWDRTNMTQMEFNVDTKANEYSFTIDNEFATFAIATYQMTDEEAQADPQWSTFNAEYRWAIGDYDIDASDYVNGDAVQLVKGTTNGTVKLPKGTYTVRVNPETMMMTITGTITPKPKLEYEAVYVAGDGTEGSAWMNGVTWDPLAEANKMTKVEGTDHLWEITFKDVTAGEYKAKFAIDGTWDINFGGSFLGYGFETNAEFNSSDIVFTTTAEKQDITLRIDLSNCAPTTDDPTTYEGATFTVIASVDKNPHVVAGCVGNNGETGAGEADLLFGTTWDGTAEANQLAYDATSKLFTKTYEAVAFEGATDIFYKIVISGWKWVPDGANLTCEIPAAGTYDITVTYNPETEEAIVVAAEHVSGVIPNGTYYVMNAELGQLINADGGVDAKGAPVTFTFNGATETYAIAVADFFAGKQWTVANAFEGMSGYYTISTVVEGVTKYVTVAEGALTLAETADDNAVWIVLQKAYWEDIANSTYTVAGTANLTGGSDWAVEEANRMTYNEETQLFEITYDNITVSNDSKPEFKVVKSNMAGEDIWYPEGDATTNWVITPEYLGGEGEYQITITFDPSDAKEIKVTGLKVEDIYVRPEAGEDIFEAVVAAGMDKKVRNITIELTKDAAYTISGPIKVPASLTINGNGATIDASALTTAMITTPSGDLTEWQEGNLAIKDVTVKGVKKGIFASARKNFLFNDFLVENSVIEITGTGGFEFDFRKGGVAKNFTINKSTIYAPTATANSLYTSQSAQRATEAPGVTVQTFAITNSTLYNLAKTKNFFTHRQSNQTWLAFTIENSIFVNCGKSGQVVKGINQGASGANPTWTIDGNVFNFDGKDTSAAEETGDANEPVRNSHAGVMAFTDAANGDFNGTFTAEPVKEEPAVEAASRRAGEVAATLSCGDPRWTIEQKQGQAITIADNIKHGSIKADKIYAAEGEAVKITATPDENFKLEKITVEGEGVDLAIEVTMDAENPNVGTFTMPAVPVIVRAMFKYVIPAGTHILNINDIYAAAKAKTAPCENATANSETKYLLNDATIEMDIFTVVSKSDRTYRIDASTDVDYGDYDSWSRLEPNGTSNKTGGRQMFIDVPEGGGVLYIGAHGAAGRALYVTKAADKTSFVDLSKVAEADVMLKHAFVAGETSPADYNVYKVQLAAGLYCITQDNGIYFTYVKFVEGETYTAPTVSVDALKAEIAAATTLLGKADITVDPGKALNTAIQTATAALKSVNAETTQDAVDQAVTDLQAAEAAYKLAVAKGKLNDEITKATELLGEASTDAGTPGADLKKAIDDAQAVFDSTESTLENVNKAIEDLQAAEEAYNMATGINGVNADKFADGAWYTVNGVRIDQPTKKGLYIHNGRKVVIK